MKKIVFIIPVIVTLVLFAESPVKIHQNEGIKFFEGTWKEAVLKAKKENKHIFLDISASWCGPCKMLKRYTFTNPEVGTFYNKNFISMEVDGEVGEGLILAERFQIQGYPSLIFLDKNEKVIMATAGYKPVNDLLGLGKRVTGQ